MTDLKVVIGERFYKWLQDHQATLFQQTWNSTSTVLQNSDLHILDCFDIAEWEWLIAPLTIAVRQAVGAMVRSICGEDINEDEVNELVLDMHNRFKKSVLLHRGGVANYSEVLLQTLTHRKVNSSHVY